MHILLRTSAVGRLLGIALKERDILLVIALIKYVDYDTVIQASLRILDTFMDADIITFLCCMHELNVEEEDMCEHSLAIFLPDTGYQVIWHLIGNGLDPRRERLMLHSIMKLAEARSKGTRCYP